MSKFILFVYILVLGSSKCYLFSVIIPIYNTGRYLDDSIGSLLNQTIGFKKIQVILINDGSTDNSEEICKKYKKKYQKNIVYIRISHSGVSKARNVGLSYAKGIFINFLDADDKWDSNAFRSAFIFFKLNKDVDLASGRMKYFETKNNYHFLDYKFYKTRKVNLTKEYNCIQLSSSSSFFKASIIKGQNFEEGVISGEDVKFIFNILLIKPIIGIIKEAVYYYRKRADHTSAIQNTENNIDFYFSTINSVQQYLINKSIELHNQTLPFIQFYLAYEILFRISSQPYKYLDKTNYKRYCSLIEQLLQFIDDKYILEQKILTSRIKIFTLSKKYNRDIRYDVILRNESFIYSRHALVDFKLYNNIIIWKIIEIKNNILHLAGQDNCWMPRPKYFYYCKIGNKTIFPKYKYFSNFDFITMYGLIEKGRVIYFDIKIGNEDIQAIQFFISYMDNEIEIFPSLGFFSHLPPLINSYYYTEDYILKKNNKTLYIYKYDSALENLLEIKYCNELKFIHKENIIEFRNNYIKYRKSNLNRKNQIWLINDRKDQAGDNGEYFFRYLNKTNPKDIEFYFIIKKNCSDYKRLKKFGQIIDFDSKEYLNKFLQADKIISSIAESWVFNPFDIDGKYIRDLYHFDFIFLQSGIIKDDLSKFYNIFSKNINLFITSSKYEYNSIFKYNYGYNKNNVILTGLPRYDNLISLKNNTQTERLILIIPTWRLYIKGTINSATYESIKLENFKNTTYFNYFNNLINNMQLLEVMKNYSYSGVLCLHPNFAAQSSFFEENEFFIVKKRCNYQELLLKASILITDYSSVFFDFGYLNKPVIYTHFDYDEYRNNHFPNGYFDYKRDGFGPICNNMECILNSIIYYFKNKCRLRIMYYKRIKRFFKYCDENNAYRTYLGIISERQEKLNITFNINLFIILCLIILRILYI